MLLQNWLGTMLIVTFDKTKITKDDTKAIVKMTAGTKSAQLPLNIRLLKSTILGNKFLPIPGIIDTPVQVNFGDQTGNLIPPVVNNPGCQQGSFAVDFTVTNGFATDPPLFLTTDDPYHITLVNPSDVNTPMVLTAQGEGTGETTPTTLTLNFKTRTPVPSTSTSVPISTTTVPGSTTTTAAVTTTTVKPTSTTTTATSTTSSVATTTTTSIKPVPGCVSVTPAAVSAGATVDVTVSLKNIDLTEVSGVNVTFGCTGVTVNSVIVNSGTEITANITVAETAQGGTCDVTITGAGDVGIVCKGAFTVNQPISCLINVSPSPIRNGIILPRIRVITLIGVGSNWTTGSTVKIAGINAIIPLFRKTDGKEIRVLAIIPSKLRLTAGNKAVTVTTGNEICTGKLVIE